MLSVIIDGDPERVGPLLAQLTAGAVEGLVREVLIVGVREGLVAELCDDMGAELAASFTDAVAQAKGALVLALPARFRFREGWIERLQAHLAGGAKAAVIKGRAFGARGVLVERGRALGGRDIARLRRQLGPLVRQVG